MRQGSGRLTVRRFGVDYVRSGVWRGQAGGQIGLWFSSGIFQISEVEELRKGISVGKWLSTVLLAIVMIFSVAACGGGGAKVSTSSTSMGQELMDLDASYQRGLITKSEYEKAKKRILKKYK